METEGKKTRSFRNFRKKNKPDSNNAQAHGSPTMLGDAGTNDGSSGEPPPAPSKSKQRLKLWDSFLHKTKKIRVRHPKEKNEALDPQRRSTSQPNIPSSSRNRNSGTSDDFQQRNATPNGVDGSADRTTSRRAAYRRQGAKFTSRSSSSLDDSAIEATSPVGHKTKKPTKFNRDSTEDDGYRSAHDRSKSAYRTSGVPSDLDASSPDGETLASGSKEIDSFTEQAVDVGDMLALGKIAVDEDTVPITEQKEPALIPVAQQLMQQHSAFVLNVNLREGKDLVIRDSCGTSDPYVKFKFGGKLVYKSRTIYKNLNPLWDEQFTIAVDDITKPVNIKVFDYDRAWNDDPMGGVDLDISALELNKETDLKLMLSEKGNAGYMGYLVMSCMLVPKAEEDKDQAKDKKTSFFRRTTTRSTESSSKKMKMQQWNGVVNIVLVEGMNLVSMDDNGLSDPYVKFRLGMEKYRSKFKPKTLNPKWLEQFDLRLFDDQSSLLEITVYDHDIRGKDDFMGRAVIDLSQLEREKTHDLSQELEDGAGTIKIMLTISGTFGGETASDLANYTPNAMDKDQLVSKYGTMKSLNNINDVGFLEVKVFRAQGLQAADFGGLSDPFCVLELVNDRVQTQTEYKTLNPEWSKVFTFHVKDIHTVLEVTIFDEDRNKKVEFLGRVEIPLLRIRNGERRWYALKDRKMLHKTKGAVLLEMDLVFNHLKAAIRTVNPRQEKFMVPEQKFKIATMKRNINRVTQLFSGFVETGKFIQSCFDWVSPLRTITAFIVYLVIVWNFELYMLPITLLLVFLKNLVVAQIVSNWKESVEDDYFEEDDDDDEDDKEKPKKQEEKKSIVDRYHAVQEVCLQVQQGLDMVASLGEKVQNTFNWSVPWLSTLAVVALVAGSIVLYYIPIRYLLLAWGINKFTKKLRKPNAIPNNELLDFLSCVPSNNELLRYRELRPDVPANTPATKKKRS